MKKGLIIFFRVTFIVLAMIIATYFGFKYYFLYQSQRAINVAVQSHDDTPIIGDPNNPFPIVEFFDYRCDHCYPFMKLTQEAIGDDMNGTTKILLRPAIIADPQSAQIAQLVLAADLQKKGETLALHQQIMALTTPPTYDTVKAMAEARGLDVPKAEKDGQSFKETLIKNTNLIRDIGFYGVPSLVIGDKGFMPQDTVPGINELKMMMIDAKTRLKIAK